MIHRAILEDLHDLCHAAMSELPALLMQANQVTA